MKKKWKKSRKSKDIKGADDYEKIQYINLREMIYIQM